MLSSKKTFCAILLLMNCLFQVLAKSSQEAVSHQNFQSSHYNIHIKTDLKNYISNETEKILVQMAQLQSSFEQLEKRVALKSSENQKSIDQICQIEMTEKQIWKPRKEAKIADLNAPEFDQSLRCLKNCDSPQIVFESCNAALANEKNNNDVYLVKEPGNSSVAFGVFCQRAMERSWTIIQRRFDGSENFNRPWNEYKNGFGSPDGEYWIGLQRLHELTTKNDYMLWIRLASHDIEVRDKRYWIFRVKDEEQKFELFLGPSDGNTPDALRWSLNRYFSTFNSDNDNFEENCARKYGGGWWFDRCGWSNLNGPYKSKANRHEEGVYWNDPSSWKNESLKYSHMAISMN